MPAENQILQSEKKHRNEMVPVQRDIQIADIKERISSKLNG